MTCTPSQLCWRDDCDFCLPKLAVAAENRGNTEDAERLEALIATRAEANGHVDTTNRVAFSLDGHTYPGFGSSWRPRDLRDAIEQRDVEQPEILRRTDKVSLLYPGRVHWFQGEPEALKGWLGHLAVAEVLSADFDGPAPHVVYIDFEDDERGVINRLRALGVPADVLLDRFHYLRPDEPLCDRHGVALPGVVDLGVVLSEHPSITLAVIDGVTEAMTTEGLNLLDNGDIAKWMRLLPRKLAETGAAVVCIDHVTKNREGQGRYAIGGQHKLAGLTGAAYKVTSTKLLSRAISEPVTGTSTVTVEKDRPGWVRSKEDSDHRIAVLEVTAYPDGGVIAKLLPPDQVSTAPPWPLRERILELLDTYEGASKNRIETDIDGKAETIRAAVRWMVAEEWVRVERVGASHRHYITDLGRDEWKDGTR